MAVCWCWEVPAQTAAEPSNTRPPARRSVWKRILVALVVTDGGRPHPRVGGLTVAEAKKEDGLR
jgi:hypothetical protein